MSSPPPNPLYPQAIATTADREALLERVAASTPFRRSARLRDFLLYVGHEAIYQPAAEIHEQKIGVAVFGKRRGYETSQDNIVRVNATELRKRIETYFTTEGADEPLIFEIPRGSYTPVFRPRPQDALDRMLEAAALTIDPPAAAPPPEKVETAPASAEPITLPVAVAQPSVTRLKIAVALLSASMLCLLVAVAVSNWRNRILQQELHPWQSQPALRAFWSNFYGGEQPPNIVLADTSYALAQDILGQQLSLSDYLNYHYQQAQPAGVLSADAREQERRDLGQILGRNSGSIGDFRVAMRLLSLETRNKAGHVLFAREYTADTLRHRSSILLGSRRSNPWVELFEDQLVYKFGTSQDRTQTLLHVEHPQAGELAAYTASNDPNSRLGYCVIALLPNLSGGGDTLIVAGTDSQATEAAGEFLTSEDALEKLLKQMGRQRFPHFQLLLKTERLHGTPLGAQVLSYRLDPR